MKRKPDDRELVGKHEGGHAFLVVDFGFTITNAFVSMQLGRGGGVDFAELIPLNEFADQAASLEKTEIGKRFVAIYWGGVIAEPSSKAEWLVDDERMIEQYAVATLFDPEFDKSANIWKDEIKSERGDWARWPDVDALIEEAKLLAKTRMRAQPKALAEAQRFLCVSANPDAKALQLAIQKQLR